ncbi:MAG: hypothetical protein HY332_04660 [Chloroflexi bacterium]|nr:hypothetical protein [Chloroflexota bacterium]
MKLVLGGLIASLVIGMWEMVVEAFVGQGLFAPPVFIAATVLRNLQDAQGGPGLGPIEPLAIVLGLMGHMMNSVILGIIFALLARRFVRGTLGLAIAGMVYGALVFVVMWLVIVPLLDPAMLRLNGTAFFLGHLMWGAAVGLVSTWAPARAGARAPVSVAAHA